MRGFRYLKLIAEMDENAEINAPEDEPSSSGGDSAHSKSYTHLGNYTVENDEIFYLSNGVSEGKMRVQNGCEYVVLEGSILDPKITSNESSIRKSRKEHADSLSEDGMVVIRDITFNTPSGAANFIRGGACNGKDVYKRQGLNRHTRADRLFKHAPHFLWRRTGYIFLIWRSDSQWRPG